LQLQRSVLLTGISGIGKTTVVSQTMSKLAPNGIIPVTLNFSAQTTSRATQLYIESRLEKKRKNKYGAPYGKHVLLFVDDVNMPQKEDYGAQPPIELLRQYQDMRGFYDRKKLFWRSIEGMTVISACAPPGGGRQELCSRFLRHFSILCMPPPSEVAMRTIFESILVGHFQTFPEQVSSLVQPIVLSTVQLFLQLSAELLPTPAKSHYTFNLRDVSKVFQGILLLKPHKVPENNPNPTLTRLWIHEASRVFHDRLNTAADKELFNKKVYDMCRIRFEVPETKEELLHGTPIMFGSYLHIGVAADEREYQEVTDVSKLPGLMDDYQEDYNHATTNPLHLVFFQEAIEHISRLARVLCQPRGNAMIVGMGGCGKQSLARFAAHMADMVCFQVEVTRGYTIQDFREDLKKLYTLAGVEGSSVVFLLTDKHIANELQVEDISNMLNTGEVRGLFQPDELDHVLSELRPWIHRHGLSEARDDMYEAFINRVRSNLHIVLAMSPVGEGFRANCLRFPALVNCCTIDWFSGWPPEALLGVGHIFLERGKFSSDEDLMQSMVQMFVEVHTSVEEAASRYFMELRRQVYVTPKSFLDFISLYMNLLQQRKDEDILARDRLLNGLGKLHVTNETVARMKADLDALRPVLQERSEKTAELLKNVHHERAEAQKLLTAVSKEEEEVLLKTELTQDMKDEAQRDLDSALPALHDANHALSALNKFDITEIKSFPKPPHLVQLTMEGVCILLQEKPDWDSAKRLLNDTSIVKRLMEYDKDNMQDNVVRRLKRVIDDPDFTPAMVAKQSNAARSMCLWVRAMETYGKVVKIVAPKKRALVEAEEALRQMEEELQHKRDHLSQINGEVDELQAQLDTTQVELKDLQHQVNLSNERLLRAGKLTAALSEEATRWQETADKIAANASLVVGDVFLGAAMVAYCGAFTGPYREQLLQKWISKCQELNLHIHSDFNLQAVLATPVEIREWHMQGLPTDNISIDNGVMVRRSQRWPMMIDPQLQANHWIKAMEARNGLAAVNYHDPNIMSSLEHGLRSGTPVLVEDFGEEMDGMLEPLLNKQAFRQGGRMMIKLGEIDVEYHESFRFYMTTKIANPHFLPEVFIKVTVIDFTVTQQGLEDQLLGLVVRKERPELEEQRDRLVVSISNDKRQLKDLEDKILKLLEESQGNILDDEVLINTLNTSKLTSAVIKGRVKEAEHTEKEIQESREVYRPVPTRGSVLYFTIADLASVDTMYQYSLTYFVHLFSHCLSTAEASPDLATRLSNLTRHTTSYTFSMICRGLFDSHKLVFAFLLATSLGRQAGNISFAHWNFFLRGSHSKPGLPANPDPEWITPIMWQSIAALSDAGDPFFGLLSSVTTKTHVWRAWATGEDPVTAPLPDFVGEKPDESVMGFLKLMLVKIMCEDKMVSACQSYVAQSLGRDFLDPPPTGLQEVYADTTKATPIIYILHGGVDSTPLLQRFASRELSNDEEDGKLHIISLGQGQGPIAEMTVKSACYRGDWVCLQNCHLARSWMPTLEGIVDELQHDEDVHPSFRLWLTSMPTPHFPVPVLQAGVKITMEPPKGLRANLRRSYTNMPEGILHSCQKPEEWRKLIYSLSFFHAVIQERRKFGPLGWNILYDFSDGDLSCSLETLQMFLDLPQSTIPWQALQYVLGEINYGGRVTDETDRRLLMCILKRYITEDVLKEGFQLSKSDQYKVPRSSGVIQDYMDFIGGLPGTETPAVFSMHNNANIVFQVAESRKLVDTVLQVQPRVADNQAHSTGISQDDMVCNLAAQLGDQLPKALDKEKAPLGKNPFVVLSSNHANSLATVLLQEMERFNRLLSVVEASLHRLQSAVQGLVVMSPDLDDMYSALLNNQVPQVWAAAAYPSIKPLASWMVDFKERMAFFDSWIQKGQPSCFWLPAFVFPQGFLTAVLQNHSRKNAIPIDHLSFRFHILKATDEAQVYGQVPDGVLVKGIYLEGAAWDLPSGRLVESRVGEMYSKLPIIHFSPSQLSEPPAELYQCPLYKTSVRSGTLSTTGQSTNFVLHINLPCQHGTTADTWMLRGAAALCAPPE